VFETEMRRSLDLRILNEAQQTAGSWAKRLHDHVGGKGEGEGLEWMAQVGGRPLLRVRGGWRERRCEIGGFGGGWGRCAGCSLSLI